MYFDQNIHDDGLESDWNINKTRYPHDVDKVKDIVLL